MSAQQEIYTIHLKGRLDPQWSDSFNGFQITVIDRDPPVTLLAGPVRDQAVLRGILNKLWDLNLTVLSITCLEGTSGTEVPSIPHVPFQDAGEHPAEEVDHDV
jgi:hypothetical protein